MAITTLVFLTMLSLLAGEQTTVGPQRGSLVIHGGGGENSEVIRQFVELAGGPDAVVVVIPTAAGRENYDDAFAQNYFRPFIALGVKQINMLHASNREEADSDLFVDQLGKATGVWFTGGRQWRMADTYLNTRTERALWQVLERGGVIGGGSAGATIQGSYLVRGDTSGPMLVMGDHEQGFGFLANTAIDQHLLSRNRQFDLLEVIRARPELLGIGLDDDAAIIVNGDEFRVIGDGYVAIYDPKLIGAAGRFYLLKPGNRFDLATRTPKNSKGEELWIPQRYEPMALDQPALQRYAGRYRADEGSFEISVGGSALVASLPDGDDRELVPVERNLFYDRLDGAKVNFEIDSRGNVTGFQWRRPGLLNQQNNALIRGYKEPASPESASPHR